MINSNDLADYFLVLLNKRFAYTACFTVWEYGSWKYVWKVLESIWKVYGSIWKYMEVYGEYFGDGIIF